MENLKPVLIDEILSSFRHGVPAKDIPFRTSTEYYDDGNCMIRHQDSCLEVDSN
jgi:hypothetical protein